MATPRGYSGQSLITMIRNLSDEKTYPSDGTILSFANAAVEQVEEDLAGIRLFKSYPTNTGDNTIYLDQDVTSILDASFSIGSPASGPLGAGAAPPNVYPMRVLPPGQFMDYTAGFPSTGTGPPQACQIVQDQGNNPTTTLNVPNAPSLSTAAGTSSGETDTVAVTLVNVAGETTPSATSTQALQTTQQCAVGSPSGQFNATGYNVYASTDGINFFLQNATQIALGSSFTIPSPILTNTASPPGANTATGAGAGGALVLQIYPPAVPGFVNLYYLARPQLWADTSGTSYSNLDSSAQELVVIKGIIRTLKARSRGDETATWQSEYDALLTRRQSTIAKRTQPRSGTVRDVQYINVPPWPWWLR